MENVNLIGKWYSVKNTFLPDSAIMISFTKDTMQIIFDSGKRDLYYFVEGKNVLITNSKGRIKKYFIDIVENTLIIKDFEKRMKPKEHIELMLTVKYKKSIN